MSECNKTPILLFPCEVEEYGVVEAVIIQQIRNWTSYNQKQGSQPHFKDNEWWCRGTMKFWSDMTGISEKTLYNKFKSLEESGIIISGQYNKLPMDRTKWYRVNPSLQTGKSITPDLVNDNYPIGVNGTTPFEEMSFPLTEGTIPRSKEVEEHSTSLPFSSLLEKFNYPSNYSTRTIQNEWDKLTETEKKLSLQRADDFIQYQKHKGMETNLLWYLKGSRWEWDLTIKNKNRNIPNEELPDHLKVWKA